MADERALYDARDRGDFAAHALSDATVRPDQGGRQGKTITVSTNSYEVKCPKNLTIAHFDVTITPMIESDGEIKAAPKTDRALPSPIMMEVWQMVLKEWTNLTSAQTASVVFDGRKNAMTAVDLPFDESTVLVELQPRAAAHSTGGRPIRRRLFKVTVRRVNSIDGSVLTQFMRGDRKAILAAGAAYTDKLAIVLQALNLVIRADALSQYRQHGAGGNRFFDPATAIPISAGAEIWRGFFQSMLPLQGGLMLNLDVAFSCFTCAGPLMEVAAKILQQGGGGGGGHGGRGGRGGNRGGRGFGSGGRGNYGGDGGHSSGPTVLNHLSAHEQQALRKKLYNVSIMVTHRPSGKLERFKGFTPTSAQACEFRRDSDGAMVTIADYFLKTYNVRLRHANLPCAIIGEGRACIPMEFCQVIPGTPIPPQRMQPEQVQDMIKHSAQKPDVRKQDTQRWRGARGYEKNESLKAWGLQVSNSMQQVAARVLPSPAVSYANGAMRDPPRFGSWNLRGQRFVAPGKPLLTLVVINFTRTPEHVVQQFVDMLLRTLAQHGMSIQVRQPRIYQGSPDSDSVKNTMTQCGRDAFASGQKKCPPQLFLIILDNSSTTLYDKIKKVASAELPFSTATQCVNGRKAFNERGQDQYCSNVAMKINLKMGGANQLVTGPQDLPRLGESTMMVGLDVAHSPPGMHRPSIVAAVSTTNGRGTKFWGELMSQSNPRQGKAQEAILEGQGLFVKLLQAWMAQNQGKLPNNIIIFRDGVSQGEYSAVADLEIAALEEACKQKTFGGGGYRPKFAFIVGTKRHRVRFFPNAQADMDRSGNLPPGTVVDSGITHPYVFDFYLQAQAGLVGTCRPAHYVVLRDTIGFSSDELERLVNSLCYTYQRATRSVSQVPIAKYAHCLAEKGSAILNADSISDFGSTISGRSAEGSTHSSAIFDEMMSKMSAAPSNGNVNLNRFAETLWFM